MKKSAIAITCVLCSLMLIATVFTVSVNAANAATTEVVLTIDETTEPSVSESVTQATKPSDKIATAETLKKADQKSVQTGNTVCAAAGVILLMSGFLTVWLEKRKSKKY